MYLILNKYLLGALHTSHNVSGSGYRVAMETDWNLCPLDTDLHPEALGLCPSLGFIFLGLVLHPGLNPLSLPKWEASLSTLCCLEVEEG